MILRLLTTPSAQNCERATEQHQPAESEAGVYFGCRVATMRIVCFWVMIPIAGMSKGARRENQGQCEDRVFQSGLHGCVLSGSWDSAKIALRLNFLRLAVSHGHECFQRLFLDSQLRHRRNVSRKETRRAKPGGPVLLCTTAREAMTAETGASPLYR